jgi:hypothetical protein
MTAATRSAALRVSPSAYPSRVCRVCRCGGTAGAVVFTAYRSSDTMNCTRATAPSVSPGRVPEPFVITNSLPRAAL